MNKKIFSKYRESKGYFQKMMDDEIIKLFKYNRWQHLVIIILFKGDHLPKYSTAMPRNPSPKINIPLNNNLVKVFFKAVKKNNSIEDGAILIQIDHRPPILRGFSYRIYPPPLNVSRSKNKGSGYNSSLDFSGVKGVVCVYYLNKGGVKKFINGEEKILYIKRVDKIFNKDYPYKAP